MGWLDFLTEVHVNQPIIENTALDFPAQHHNHNNESGGDDDDIFKKYANGISIQKCILSLRPLSNLEWDVKTKFRDAEYPFTAFLARKDLPFKTESNVNSLVVYLQVLDENFAEKDSSFYCCIRILDHVSVESTKCLYVNNAFLNLSPLRIFSNVTLQLIKEKPEVESITLRTYSNRAIENFKKYVAKMCGNGFVVINSESTLQITETESVRLEFEEKYCIVDCDFLNNCEYKTEFPEETASTSDLNSKSVQVDYCSDINQALEEEILLAVELNLKFNTSENLLIVGKRTVLFLFA